MTNVAFVPCTMPSFLVSEEPAFMKKALLICASVEHHSTRGPETTRGWLEEERAESGVSAWNQCPHESLKAATDIIVFIGVQEL